MNENDIKNLIKQELQTYALDNQYGVSAIPYHQHTGVDSPKIPITSIQDSPTYIAISIITLAPNQIKLLHTTPVTLIPAQGQNSVIIVESIFAKLTWNAHAYTGNNNFEFRYTDASGTKITADIPFGFSQSNTNAYIYTPAITTAFSMFTNQPIVIDVPTSNLASGDSPITFLLKYRVITL